MIPQLLFSNAGHTCSLIDMSLILSAGGWAELLATGFSVLAILGAAVVYWVLMSNFLYSTVQYIHDEIVGTNDTDTGEASEL